MIGWEITRKEVIRRLEADETQTRIAEGLGISRSYVCKIAAQIGITGRYRSPAYKLRRGTLPGQHVRLSDALLNLPDGAVNWLASQTPDGADLSEFVGAIILDAYHETGAAS
jgi:hypothetical protein